MARRRSATSDAARWRHGSPLIMLLGSVARGPPRRPALGLRHQGCDSASVAVAVPWPRRPPVLGGPSRPASMRVRPRSRVSLSIRRSASAFPPAPSLQPPPCPAEGIASAIIAAMVAASRTRLRHLTIDSRAAFRASVPRAPHRPPHRCRPVNRHRAQSSARLRHWIGGDHRADGGAAIGRVRRLIAHPASLPRRRRAGWHGTPAATTQRASTGRAAFEATATARRLRVDRRLRVRRVLRDARDGARHELHGDGPRRATAASDTARVFGLPGTTRRACRGTRDRCR